MRAKQPPTLNDHQLSLYESHVQRGETDECWHWTGHVSRTGYGIFRSENRNNLVHRLAWVQANSRPIPEADGILMDIGHVCASRAATVEEAIRHRSCVNPAHLEPQTRVDNLRQSPFNTATRNAAKGKCPQGHTYDRVDKRGYRYCTACRRITQLGA